MRIPGLKTLAHNVRRLRSRLVNGAVILGYHRVEEVPYDTYSMCVSPHHFFEQLGVLRRYAHPMRLDELVRGLREGDLPRGAVAVTFDDGYRDFYTAALPAWMAAGFEQALGEGSLAAGEEVLTLGYGSGDAAEVIPFFMADGWQEAAAKIQFADAMELTLDLNRQQYEALHDGRRVDGLDYVARNEFIIDRVGESDDRHFADLGIEYYRYIA